MVKASSLVIGAGLAILGVVALTSRKVEKNGSAGVSSDVVATSAEIREIQASKTRAEDPTPVTQSDVTNLRVRQETQQFAINSAMQQAENLRQQAINTGSRLAIQSSQGASYIGSPNLIIHRVRQDGKIYLYDQNGQFLGFETGATAAAYADKFNRPPEPVRHSTPTYVPEQPKPRSLKTQLQFTPTIDAPSMASRSSDATRALTNPKKDTTGLWRAV